MKRVFASLAAAAFVAAYAGSPTRAQSIGPAAQPTCGHAQLVRMNVGQNAVLYVPDVPNPLKTIANAKASPTSTPRTYWLVNGDTLIHNGIPYKAPKGGEVGITIPVTPSPAPKTSPKSSPTTAPTPYYPFSVANSNDRILTVGSTPSPEPTTTASSAAETPQPEFITAEYPITAHAAGVANVTIGNGHDVPMCYSVRIAPGEASKIVFTTGVGASHIPIHNAAAGSPAPNGSQFVYFNENMVGQTFVPILVNFRFTDFPSRYQLYLSGGFSASGQTTNQLFGLSAGTDYYLFTFGLHSANYNALQPYITPNAFNAIPAGAPLTFSTRTTRPFTSISFPICALSGLFGFTGGGSACATPSPAPSASPKS